MKHTKNIKSYNESHEKLAEDICDLYYDSLAEFFRLLSGKLEKDGKADDGRGRIKLAKELLSASKDLESAANHIDVAWEICEPYVKKWLESKNAN
ncbi:hypothetical protein [Allochromatium palmeri]|uniref:Uncharacterized protein n=1 Tax=Allochromatium palmeri TaxID=231048 RepID=A0A6N8EFE2_9GAMM|nr:hypothetical protein [Allochromatium palmeri]MTW21579.1 hypothetical protein [Allochromatium palmeri]